LRGGIIELVFDLRDRRGDGVEAVPTTPFPCVVPDDNDDIDVGATLALLAECQPCSAFIATTSMLTALPDTLITTEERIELAAQLERASSWLDAIKQPNLAALAAAAGKKERDAGRHEDIVLELAFALGWSEYMAGDRLGCAAELTRLPLTWRELAEAGSAGSRPASSRWAPPCCSPARTPPSSTAASPQPRLG
jgi:hypothetical protein